MPTRAIEWMVRTAMLALAGLVTLSILGSIAAVSNSPGARSGGFMTETRTAPPAEETGANRQEVSEAPSDRREADAATAASAADTRAGAGEALTAPPPSETARWLEAIAYALLALAGLLALAILLLWRGVRQMRRLADAAEGRP